MLKSLRLSNFLSFAPDAPSIELRSLNVLIGANGSGKTNFLKALRVLQATTYNFMSYLNQENTFDEWRHRFSGDHTLPIAIDAHFEIPVDRLNVDLNHRIELRNHGKNTAFFETTVKNDGSVGKIQKLFEESTSGQQYLSQNGTLDLLETDDDDRRLSIIERAARMNGQTSFKYLNRFLRGFRLYDSWVFGPNNIMRASQKHVSSEPLYEPDYSNFLSILHDLNEHPQEQRSFMKFVQEILPDLENVFPKIRSTALDPFFVQNGVTMSMRHLSDGTLRYIFLGALLHHPTLPSIVCIEEPELGLHPDMLRSVIDLIKKASARAQIIITTHSDLVLDMFSDTPESILVFDREEEKTTVSRLSQAELGDSLERYSLGDYWLRGGIGGKRW